MKIVVAVTIALAAFFASETEASKKYVKLLPNGGNVPNVPAIGHTDGTGDEDATNAFGDAFAEADYAWTKALCEADSDGDGQTNGQELGDPCCTWTVGGTPLWSSGVSNPGDASSTSDPSLWANACGSSTSETPTTTGSTTGTSDSTSETTTAPAGSSTGHGSHSESTPTDSEQTSASSSTNSTSSGHTSSPTTTTEKCASDLASTRARVLRVNN
ncbi:Temptin [Phytophthora citrophthora]|uniref:Temptin n=1 Tax=Phytophthora citrophthora TaxID=4793 RepID=A0AAD9GGJ3_9STRA|nr:Temptin [Phytophthora citrophthora]